MLNTQDEPGGGSNRERNDTLGPRGRHAVIEFYDFATQKTHPVLTLEKLAAYLLPSLSATADGKTIYYTQWDSQSAIKMIEFVP